jgi:hypothetical protein
VGWLKMSEDYKKLPPSTAAAGVIPGIRKVTGSDSRTHAVGNPFAIWLAPSVGYQMAWQWAAAMTQLYALWGGAAVNAANAYLQGWTKSYTETEIERWIDEVDSKRKIAPNEETSPGGRYYIYMKEGLQSRLNMLPEPARSNTRQFLMDSPHIQSVLRSDTMAEQFERIDPTIERIYRRKHPKLAEKMRWHGLLYDEKYNHKFLAENSKGEIVEVTQNEVASWFKKGGGADGQDFPHVIITSSHAQGETLGDVRSIIHGYTAQVDHSADGAKSALSVKCIDQGVGPGDTVILYACDVRKSPWQNGADLLRRVNELKRIGNNRDTEFRHISPGAVRIQKLMLKCKSADPGAVDAQDMRPAEVSLAMQGKSPIMLRPDAGIIAHHFQPMGYSKGGNVISDVGRYGNYALTYTRSDGSALFRMNPKDPICLRTGDFTMSTRNVRNIMRGHAYLAHAAVEVGLSDWDIDHGMVRKAVNNQHDLISAHGNYEGNEYRDHRLKVKGTTTHHGHAPDEFLGKRNEDPQLTDEFFVRGYMLDDPQAQRYSFQYFASNHGKAAIGHLSFKEGAEAGTLVIEPSPGTLDSKVMRHKATIERTLTKALGSRVTIEENLCEPGRIKLQCKGKDFIHNPDALARLRTGFVALRQPDVQGLVIAQEIIDQEIEVQLQRALQASRLKPTPHSQISGRAA